MQWDTEASVGQKLAVEKDGVEVRLRWRTLTKHGP
jgi:hypothetical protein